MNPLDQLIGRSQGPSGVVRWCRVPGCRFFLYRRTGAGGGRGEGFREGNRQRGEMIRHLRAEHPEAVEQQIRRASHVSEAT